MKLFTGILKFTGRFLLLVVIVISVIISIEYITCPVYDFTPGKPFTGSQFYNPYHQLDPALWRKANFQVQSYAWAGITSGRKNTNIEINRVYKELGYDIIATSDYQKINRFGADKPSYIPVYEHGYGIKKNHQVLIGSSKVLWKDYPIFQTIHNKQNILNLLRPDNELVCIAHPKLRNGYPPDDFKKLANYDAIEVLNNYRTSLEQWDEALSSGNYVTIIGDDDAHDISNPDEIGHHCTFINASSLTREAIIKSLKSGRAFGAKIFRPEGESFEKKIVHHNHLPDLIKVEINNDSLLIEVNSVATEIRFIGQGGIKLDSTLNSSFALYKIQSTDTYVRTEIEFPDQSIYYLNPVCRYDGTQPATMSLPKTDMVRTSILRIVGFATLLFLFLNYIFIRKKIKRKRS